MTNTTARGYGYAHRVLRKREAKAVSLGEMACARCGGWINPDEPWDLGHNPFDRGQYLGPMHRRCNRDTRLERRLRRPRVVRPPAEDWL